MSCRRLVSTHARAASTLLASVGAARLDLRMASTASISFLNGDAKVADLVSTRLALVAVAELDPRTATTWWTKFPSGLARSVGHHAAVAKPDPRRPHTLLL